MRMVEYDLQGAVYVYGYTNLGFQMQQGQASQVYLEVGGRGNSTREEPGEDAPGVLEPPWRVFMSAL
jgi:hypothetical protein